MPSSSASGLKVYFKETSAHGFRYLVDERYVTAAYT